MEYIIGSWIIRICYFFSFVEISKSSLLFLINEGRSKLFSCFEADEFFHLKFEIRDFQILRRYFDVYLREICKENFFVAKIDDIDSVL